MDEACRGGPAVEWTLWAGTVGFDSALPERFAAAEATGCRRVSVSPPEVVRLAESGTPAAHIGRDAAARGLELVVDPVMNWYPHNPLPRSRFAAVSAEDALRVAEELGAVALTAIAAPTSGVPLDALAEPFARVCDRAVGFGAQVQFEFLPFSVVPSLRLAWAIVQAADRPNGGVLFDTWHFYRGDPDFDVLAAVPGERIFCVQLDDALAEPAEDLRAETNRRLLPGDGALDLVRAIRALDDIGALRSVGPEVLNPELAAMPVGESAALAMAKAREVVTTALQRDR